MIYYHKQVIISWSNTSSRFKLKSDLKVSGGQVNARNINDALLKETLFAFKRKAKTFWFKFIENICGKNVAQGNPTVGKVKVCRKPVALCADRKSSMKRDGDFRVFCVTLFVATLVRSSGKLICNLLTRDVCLIYSIRGRFRGKRNRS